MFRSLYRWLGLEKPATNVGFRPHRTLELQRSYDETFDRAIAGIERDLGGTLRENDRARGYIEASFGLTFSERIACTIERIDDTHTRITIEARRPAGVAPAAESRYVDALAAAMER